MEDEPELLAAVASAHIRFAGTSFQDLGKFRQDGVAVEMPVRVVDLLEVVEVDHHERDRILVAARALHLLEKLLGKRAPVGQLGQLVREGVFLLRLEQLRVADRDRRL